MAISHVQPLLFLLASLFCLPALRATDFHYCNDIGYSYGNITRVEISPDDNPTVTVFGYASDEAQTIRALTVTVGLKAEGYDQIPVLKFYDEFDVGVFLVEPGTNFNFTLSDFPWDDKPLGDSKFVLTLTDDAENNPSEKEVVKMCICLDIPTAPPVVDSA